VIPVSGLARFSVHYELRLLLRVLSGVNARVFLKEYHLRLSSGCMPAILLKPFNERGHRSQDTIKRQLSSAAMLESISDQGVLESLCFLTLAC
jgi:hypothetical protein